MIAVQNINLGDELATNEMVKLTWQLTKIRQHRTSHHQKKAATEDLIILQQPLYVLPESFDHPAPIFLSPLYEWLNEIHKPLKRRCSHA